MECDAIDDDLIFELNVFDLRRVALHGKQEKDQPCQDKLRKDVMKDPKRSRIVTKYSDRERELLKREALIAPVINHLLGIWGR